MLRTSVLQNLVGIAWDWVGLALSDMSCTFWGYDYELDYGLHRLDGAYG